MGPFINSHVLMICKFINNDSTSKVYKEVILSNSQIGKKGFELNVTVKLGERDAELYWDNNDNNEYS